jgi:hypothetical protein
MVGQRGMELSTKSQHKDNGYGKGLALDLEPGGLMNLHMRWNGTELYKHIPNLDNLKCNYHGKLGEGYEESTCSIFATSGKLIIISK